jgi:hypothetical protein
MTIGELMDKIKEIEILETELLESVSSSKLIPEKIINGIKEQIQYLRLLDISND